MDINDFIKNLADQFEQTDISSITPVTVFREMDEWDSFIGMSVIAMADDIYHVKLTGDDMRTAVTVEDLYNFIKSKM